MLEKADHLFDLKKYKEAIKLYDIVLKAIPDSIPAMVSRSIAAMLVKKSDNVLQCFLKRNNTSLMALYMTGAQMFAEEGQYAKAFNIYDMIIAARPDNHMAHFNMGVAFANLYSKNQKKEVLKEAIKCYDKALTIKPDFADAAFNKVLMLFHLKKYAQAVRYCDKFLKKNPNDALILEHKGISLDIMEEHEKAISCYEKALKIRPESISIRHNMAVALYNLDRLEEAQELLDEEARIDPNLERYADLKKVLAELLSEDKS